MKKELDSYDKIEREVIKYWKKEYPCDVIVFFWQKYKHEKDWEWCEELVESNSSTDCTDLTFHNDFCEGQTDVAIIDIVPLEKVISFYSKLHYVKGALKLEYNV